ncbi:hypothetical protein LQZ21_02520 [Treponema sp. TIM-1]|uniref:hypothetical protein n=1 Tax=Treponema sp. TIM-1 TaxID=2898417 RepID=UPI00397F52C5
MNSPTGFFPFLVIVAVVIIGIIVSKKQEKEDAQDFDDISTSDEFKQRKLNKIVRVSLSGGLIGAIGTNPRKALSQTIHKYNTAGWNCHQILPHTTRNIFIMVLQIIILVVTLGIWTFGAGYLVLFEKDITDYANKPE